MFREAFNYLFTDYDFSVISNANENWGYSLVAANLTTGIEIICEYREAFIQVILFRLVDGEIVNNINSAIKNNDPILGHGLGWIIKLRNPEAQIKSAYEYETNISNYTTMVAEKLKAYASDVLSGDFSIFSDLDTIVKENYKKYK